MTTKLDKADDDIDAFEALESEEKEFVKVLSHQFLYNKHITDAVYLRRMQKLIVF
jgi:hypothetical protein